MSTLKNLPAAAAVQTRIMWVYKKQELSKLNRMDERANLEADKDIS